MSSFSVGCSCLLLLVFCFFVCLEFQIIRFVFYGNIFFIEISFVFLPPPPQMQLSAIFTVQWLADNLADVIALHPPLLTPIVKALLRKTNVHIPEDVLCTRDGGIGRFMYEGWGDRTFYVRGVGG